eukprot:scaffold39276_cov199-Amphora_coffeaeformis.AAC.1
MQGTAEDYAAVERAVNRLEADYTAIQTLDFLNMAQAGRWQLLFSTQLTKPANPLAFRLRELTVQVVPARTTGTWTTQAVWDLAPGADAQFTCSGTFGVTHGYEIVQGARASLRLEEDKNTLQLAKGSAIPDDIPGLVGMLHRSMPPELFDATGYAADTTYLDDTLRIVRYTGGGGGGKFEGVRDIFLRMDGLDLQQQPQDSSNPNQKNAKNDEVRNDGDDGLF